MRLWGAVPALACALVCVAPSFAATDSPLKQCRWKEISYLDPADLAELKTQFKKSAIYAECKSNQLREAFDKKELQRPQELAAFLDSFFRERGYPASVREMLLKMRPAEVIGILNDEFGHGLPALDKLAGSGNPALIRFVTDRVLDPNRPSRVAIAYQVVEATELYALPVATTKHEDLNKGTGGTTRVLAGELPGKGKVALKIQNDETTDSLGGHDERDLLSLADLGAPKVYGRVRVQMENGRWRPATAIEFVPGADVLTLDFARVGNKPAPLEVTDQHIAAFENLIRKVEQNGWVLGDIQPGDFMLTPDGRVMPLDMTLEKTRGNNPPAVWQTNLGVTSRTLREVFERLCKVYEHQHQKKPTITLAAP